MHYEREDGCRAWLTYGGLHYQFLQNLLEEFSCAEAIYDRFMTDHGDFLKDKITSGQLRILRKQSKPDAMHNTMVAMRRKDMGILTMADYEYPDALRNISDPPPLLFYRGNPDCLTGRCLTMVGARAASPMGLESSREIARGLSESGVTVVSGFALGIDSACHMGCMDGGSPTCAVLGCGLDVPYPVENEQLREDLIRKGGLLLSEYPPGDRATPWHFPVRNRILSGVSRAVLFMEGRTKSGSMSTVQHALDQGKDVFAFPGKVDSPWAEGAHQLLREGAQYFTCAADVLEDLKWQDDKPLSPAKAKQELPALTEEQRAVLTQLSRDDLSFDQLSACTGLNPSSLSGTLTMLQLLGLVRSLPGKLYSRI